VARSITQANDPCEGTLIVNLIGHSIVLLVGRAGAGSEVKVGRPSEVFEFGIGVSWSQVGMHDVTCAFTPYRVAVMFKVRTVDAKVLESIQKEQIADRLWKDVALLPVSIE